MKKIFYILFFFSNFNIYGQITTPIVRANFGVDGDLSANIFNSGEDDWFNDIPSTGVGVIDTTGAAAIKARYATDPKFRNLAFGKTMSFPPLSIVNNKLWIDAVFIRDYHGSDSTMFGAGSSKNAMSPADWSCPVAQSVPDKNEILDVMAHLRRDGTQATDSLWLFGGVSIESTNGDRYFDYEIYQTELYYNRATLKFYNYGPDGGHTSWKFDAAGNVTQVGDIIFSANYGSSTLSSIEARIWINPMSLMVKPAAFNWSGSIDIGPAGYGYASIIPKTSGTFYSGIESSANTWAGPFSLIRGDNSIVSNYTAGQFLEFSVNLTKLGIDSRTLLGNFGCNMVFKRILVKTRSSTSFTASLKDFVGPFDLFEDFKAKVETDVTTVCGITGPSMIKVSNPVNNFIYTWSTSNGHIIGKTTGNYIFVDSAGTYVVTQQMQAGCPAFASDVIVIQPFNKGCITLEKNLTSFTGVISNQKAQLDWSVMQNEQISYFELEKSSDGIHFSTIAKINSHSSNLPITTYNFTDDTQEILPEFIYFRLKIVSVASTISYSKIIRLSNKSFVHPEVRIIPNPVRNLMQIGISSSAEKNVHLSIYDVAGRLMHTMSTGVRKGNSILTVSDFQNWPNGVYSVKVVLGNDLFVKKMILRK